MDKSISKDTLQQAAVNGEKDAARALSILAKRPVKVETKAARVADLSEAVEIVDKIEEHAVIAYTQAITGVGGVSMLSLNRSDALKLTDLFNSRPPGTTVILQELDRSTIRETLNILSNSYVTHLTRLMNNTIVLSVPSMITRDNLENIVKKTVKNDNAQVILFETGLSVEDADFVIELYFFFLAGDEEGEA